MKKLTLIIFLLILNIVSYSQSINGKLGTSGQFIIRDTIVTYLSLSQSTGDLSLFRSMVLPNTGGSSLGVIYKGTDRFIHNYGSSNSFLGINAGNFVMTGTNNTALGISSLQSNTTGSNNTALGESTLYYNTGGSQNTALGYQSLFISNGSQNTGVGWSSLNSLLIGNNNTAIGYNAQVPGNLADNQVRIGNTLVTYAGIQVPWTITSDRRWKENILPANLGLNFISKLNPVSYSRINDVSKKSEYGFIAQDVEEVLKESGIENSGMITKTDDGMYEFRYNDLFAPMVKAIQELKAENDGLKLNIEKLDNSNKKLITEVGSMNAMNEKIAKMEQKINELTSVKNTSFSESK